MKKPGNIAALRRLVSILDFHQPSKGTEGKYAECQSQINTEIHQICADLNSNQKHNDLVQLYRISLDQFEESGIEFTLPVTQLFRGKQHTVNEQPTTCGDFSQILSFRDTQSIPITKRVGD